MEKFRSNQSGAEQLEVRFNSESNHGIVSALQSITKEQREKVDELTDSVDREVEKLNDFDDSINVKISIEPSNDDYDPELEAASLPARLKMLERIKNNIKELNKQLDIQTKILGELENDLSLFIELESKTETEHPPKFSDN